MKASENLSTNIIGVWERVARLLQPVARTSPDAWGAANRIYPSTAALPGQRNPYLTPYMIEPMRAAATCLAKRIVIVTAAQSGKTENLLDLAGQRLDERPAPILYVGPTQQFLNEQVEPRIMTLLDGAETLTNKVQRGKRMTKTRKVVAGVPFRLAHAGSSSALKSDPAALALVDEYDEMLTNVKGQGDPLGLVERRGDTFADFVAVVTSTPRTGLVRFELDEQSKLEFWSMSLSEEVAESPVWGLWQQGTRHHWCWPCPHCSAYFVPRFDRLRWPTGATPAEAAEHAWLECASCGGVIEEQHKADMNARGRYVAPGQRIDLDGNVTGTPARVPTLSYWVSGLCSPFVTFGDRGKAFLEAETLGDTAAVQTAINAGFGELYSPGGRDFREWQAVSKRKQRHHFGEVPDKVVRLTAAVDVGSRGFFYSIRGWGERGTSWQIVSDELFGYTNEPEVWRELARVLTDTYDGLPITIALIDSGFRAKPDDGRWVNSVYEFCARYKRFCRATKGYATLPAPIQQGMGHVTLPGHGPLPEIPLWKLDTDFWKSKLHEHLTWKANEPGGFWLSADATEDYCRQLVSEVRVIQSTGKPEWIKMYRRNHYFDVEAMNEAAGHYIGAGKYPIGATRQSIMPVRSPAPEADPTKPSWLGERTWMGDQRRDWFGQR